MPPESGGDASSLYIATGVLLKPQPAAIPTDWKLGGAGAVKTRRGQIQPHLSHCHAAVSALLAALCPAPSPAHSHVSRSGPSSPALPLMHQDYSQATPCTRIRAVLLPPSSCTSRLGLGCAPPSKARSGPHPLALSISTGTGSGPQMGLALPIQSVGPKGWALLCYSPKFLEIACKSVDLPAPGF